MVAGGTSCRSMFIGLVLFSYINLSKCKGFLKHDQVHHAANRRGNIRNAMDSSLGCGPPADAENARERLAVTKKRLAPLWDFYPTGPTKHMEWRMVRYMVHRYFLRRSSLLLRGLEQSRRVNESNAGVAHILERNSLADTVLGPGDASGHFSFDDAASLIAVVEQLVLDSESALLTTVYARTNKSPQESVDGTFFYYLVESYMIHWLLSDDAETLDAVMDDRSLINALFLQWGAIREFIQGLVKHVTFFRQRDVQVGKSSIALTGQYSFNDVRDAISQIASSFAFYWDSECQAMKTALINLDRSGTGRIPLSTFYNANADGDWHFGESEEYLRELGVLDETSSWSGPKVLISNYLYGASNCVVTTDDYYICCLNECENILNEIERIVGGPLAEAIEIEGFVSNFSTFEDEPIILSKSLRAQLEKIASIHAGKVPLHGRLFAQWLHYVFPRDCPFPHKVGLHTIRSPLEYGAGSIVSDDEVSRHAQKAESDKTQSNVAELEAAQFMSQWSEEEELVGDYSELFRTRFGYSICQFLVFFLSMAMAYAAYGRMQQQMRLQKQQLKMADHAHFI